MGVAGCTDRQSDRQAVMWGNISLSVQWKQTAGALLQKQLFQQAIKRCVKSYIFLQGRETETCQWGVVVSFVFKILFGVKLPLGGKWQIFLLFTCLKKAALD